MKSIMTMTMTVLLAAVLATSAHAHEDHDKHGVNAAAKTAADAPAKTGQTPFGVAGDPKQVTRIIKMTMSDDMRFTPEVLHLKQGETVTLSISNGGKMLHEIVLGTKDSLEGHAKMMRKHPNMAHSAPHMLHVTAGAAGEIVWRFNQAGQFDFACLLPGHFEAGMRGRIIVAPALPGKDR